MVPTQQVGIQLYVRNKRPDDMNVFTPERTVLFVHGATYPSETSFDLPVGGASWMDQIARRGFDVYLVDLPGYGKSTRPKEMDQPADTNGPIVDTEVAVAAVGAAVLAVLGPVALGGAEVKAFAVAGLGFAGVVDRGVLQCVVRTVGAEVHSLVADVRAATPSMKILLWA